MFTNKRYWLVLIFVAVLVAVWLSPHGDPTEIDMGNMFAPPSAEHFLGTDHLGRDVWSRVAAGLWRTLVVTLVASATSIVLGLALGVTAGYLGGAVKSVIMLFTDLVMIIPTFVGALIFAAIFGLTPTSAGVVLGFFGIGPFVNQSCALTAAARDANYLKVEYLNGTSTPRILVHHIFPAILPPVMAYIGASAAGTVLSYAGLSYIGLGVDTTIPDWGTMLNEYRVELTAHPLLMVGPMVGILFFAVLCHFFFDLRTWRRR